MYLNVLRKKSEIISITSYPKLPKTTLVLALKVSYPGKPLSPGQTRMTGHPKNKATQMVIAVTSDSGI